QGLRIFLRSNAAPSWLPHHHMLLSENVWAALLFLPVLLHTECVQADGLSNSSVPSFCHLNERYATVQNQYPSPATSDPAPLNTHTSVHGTADPWGTVSTDVPGH